MTYIFLLQSADETGSELLPPEWNADKEYVIRYKRNDDKFLLMSSHSDVNVIIFNLTVSIVVFIDYYSVFVIDIECSFYVEGF